MGVIFEELSSCGKNDNKQFLRCIISLPFLLECECAKGLMRNHVLGSVIISAAVFCSSDFWEESLMCFTQTNVFIIYSKRSWNVFFNNWFLLNIWEHRDVQWMLQQRSNEAVRNMLSKKKKKERQKSHIFFTLLVVRRGPAIIALLKNRTPPPVGHHKYNGSSINRKCRGEWRRLTVSYIVAAPIIRMGMSLSYPPGRLPVQRISPLLTALHCPDERTYPSMCIMAGSTNSMAMPRGQTSTWLLLVWPVITLFSSIKD